MTQTKMTCLDRDSFVRESEAKLERVFERYVDQLLREDGTLSNEWIAQHLAVDVAVVDALARTVRSRLKTQRAKIRREHIETMLKTESADVVPLDHADECRIYRIRQKLGLAKQRTTTATDEEIKKALVADPSRCYTSIANELKISRNSVRFVAYAISGDTGKARQKRRREMKEASGKETDQPNPQVQSRGPDSIHSMRKFRSLAATGTVKYSDIEPDAIRVARTDCGHEFRVCRWVKEVYETHEVRCPVCEPFCDFKTEHNIHCCELNLPGKTVPWLLCDVCSEKYCQDMKPHVH